MRRKGIFEVKFIDKTIIAVSVDGKCNKTFKLNETGLFLWKMLAHNVTEDDMVAALCDEYNVDDRLARRDVSNFIEALDDEGILLKK